jgi:hypothetical protein
MTPAKDDRPIAAALTVISHHTAGRCVINTMQQLNVAATTLQPGCQQLHADPALLQLLHPKNTTSGADTAHSMPFELRDYLRNLQLLLRLRQIILIAGTKADGTASQHTRTQHA